MLSTVVYDLKSEKRILPIFVPNILSVYNFLCLSLFDVLQQCCFLALGTGKDDINQFIEDLEKEIVSFNVLFWL